MILGVPILKHFRVYCYRKSVKVNGFIDVFSHHFCPRKTNFVKFRVAYLDNKSFQNFELLMGQILGLKR